MTDYQMQERVTPRVVSDAEILGEISRDFARQSSHPFCRRVQAALWGDDDLPSIDDVFESKRDKDQRWGVQKMAAEHLADAYESISPERANKVRTCGQVLTFGVDKAGVKRLSAANFCRLRLCPMCQWRRSLKLFGQMQQVMEHIAGDGYQYIFLTLTMRNVPMEGLSAALDQLVGGFNLLLKYKEVKAVCKGWYRGLEVTHNLDRESPSFDTWHPHLHVVIAVNKSYFSGAGGYLSQPRWAELWQRALDVDYAPRVDVRKVKGATASAVCEVTKYAAKSNDYIMLDDWDLTVKSIEGLDRALSGRRLVGFGGIFRKVRALLALDDADTGDLIDVDGKTDHEKDQYYVSYAWHTGVCQYLRKID